MSKLIGEAFKNIVNAWESGFSLVLLRVIGLRLRSSNQFDILTLRRSLAG